MLSLLCYARVMLLYARMYFLFITVYSLYCTVYHFDSNEEPDILELNGFILEGIGK